MWPQTGWCGLLCSVVGEFQAVQLPNASQIQLLEMEVGNNDF